jgi:hypothetical protein
VFLIQDFLGVGKKAMCALALSACALAFSNGAQRPWLWQVRDFETAFLSAYRKFI